MLFQKNEVSIGDGVVYGRPPSLSGNEFGQFTRRELLYLEHLHERTAKVTMQVRLESQPHKALSAYRSW